MGSKMELRSSRSRSKTPFVSQELTEKEATASGNLVEKTVLRTTRRSTVIKASESASSSTDEINTSREFSSTAQSKASRRSGAKSEKSLRSRLFRTSDYSSEDGENEVSSTKTINQNERNQLIEDARALANGSNMPALELYRKSGRYWDVYPKTDWTYSQHSKDRIEIAPGVVAMPNMSRKTIHSLNESESLYAENVSHKNINTDATLMSKFTSKTGSFNNNTEDFYIKRQSYSRWRSFTRSITTIFTSIFTVFYYVYSVQTSFFSHIHRAASKVMLWDTYLLRKTRPGDKATKLALLCMIPLLLFGGIWLLSTLGGALYGLFSNSTLPTTSSFSTFSMWGGDSEDTKILRHQRDLEPDNVETLTQLKQSEVNVDLGHERKFVEEKIVKITEKVYVEPPTATEVAASLTNEQIEAIAMAVRNSLNLETEKQLDSDDLVQKILENPAFMTIVNNFHESRQSQKGNLNADTLNKHQSLIDGLLKQIEGMRQEISLYEQLRRDSHSRLSLDIKKCCQKRPIINIEGYVTQLVTNLLNNPEFLRNQQGLNAWLRSLFVAREDLEYRLANITSNMDGKMAALVETNGFILMDKVAAKLKDINVAVGDSLPAADEHVIRKIVKDTLAIYDADKTGLVDYAMETIGGQIVTTRCTEPYHYGKAVVSVLGIPLWYPSNSPRIAITPTIAPGECWAFQNFPGFIVIKLSSKIRVDAFSMEHISKLLVPEGKTDSAPKDFEVYGLNEENDKNPILLGSYHFGLEGEPLQFFPVETDNQVFEMVELRIVSNHGNPNYTCLYRFRVHGKLHHEEAR